MSRTYRNRSPWWDWLKKRNDPRCHLANGYDGKPSSYLHDRWSGCRESWQGAAARRFLKRRYSKDRRRLPIEMD